ncbi:hypothetical protein ACLOJK_022294 [Asimina triloba]
MPSQTHWPTSSRLAAKQTSCVRAAAAEERERGMATADLIAFFDVETTIPYRPGQGFYLLEFGAILVCPRSLVEVDSFSTLIRPADLSSISSSSDRCNGITRAAVATAPLFDEVADKIYNLLHGRIWAGHNIIRFDCVRIREAFAAIDRPAPEPKGIIDSLALLTQRFGRRAGNMKTFSVWPSLLNPFKEDANISNFFYVLQMATLATYFGLGKQKHRSLDDVRMNIEVVKNCATVLFLVAGHPNGESSLSEVLMTNTSVSGSAAARNCNIKIATVGSCSNRKNPSVVEQENCENLFPKTNSSGGTPTHDTSDTPNSRADPFNLMPIIDLMRIDPCRSDLPLDEKFRQDSPDTLSSRAALAEVCSDYAGFLDTTEVTTTAITASSIPAYRCSKIVLLHQNILLQLFCAKLKVRFGLNAKFQDHAGRPRLNIVVDAPRSLCQVLDVCDKLAWKLLVESGSSSEWRPVVTRKDSFSNSSTIRLNELTGNIPTIGNGDGTTYATEVYQKEASGNIKRHVFSSIDVTELDSLLCPGTFVDACFKLDTYDYQQSAGIRLVANKGKWKPICRSHMDLLISELAVSATDVSGKAEAAAFLRYDYGDDAWPRDQ